MCVLKSPNNGARNIFFGRLRRHYLQLNINLMIIFLSHFYESTLVFHPLEFHVPVWEIRKEDDTKKTNFFVLGFHSQAALIFSMTCEILSNGHVLMSILVNGLDEPPVEVSCNRLREYCTKTRPSMPYPHSQPWNVWQPAGRHTFRHPATVESPQWRSALSTILSAHLSPQAATDGRCFRPPLRTF